ncbi:sporulation protein YqfC [Peribacillus castrilensis]|jgi:sporulation protein YqfC|uniref:Sporulation protein YqfC n=4 Tax=Peribacillus TaxID=2675229 RepID=A0A098FHJ7_9BACI|nr:MULTISPECIES: sporulation protein YqfC [Bacillales]KOR79715.1 sporulation protein YqfC [Bacillus sp. FJAT-21352]KOR86607.1 sporulation protein YqfC [Bacillus sp. FJAT-22058]KRF49759.1 sporulation protein YqfC [Bacillus sp. Soil745]MBD8135017.1 sporulation protein YqfC [Bacillus sp. CFBP 13597]MBL3642254.1 sporulation protein YqfC [Bacillus sp. RHFB]MCD1161230.1 sporulation protein YqfC [Peribacillus castrilensis]MCP1092615.1 sporulation protein YqfC [Bacillaceae bacterium OS4b]MDP9740075
MARNWGKKVKQLMTKTMDLPQDVMMDLPRITMIGQLHIYIENHRGLLAFTDSEVRLMLKNGQLLIKGNAFVIKTILPEEIMLEGKIDKVYFINE